MALAHPSEARGRDAPLLDRDGELALLRAAVDDLRDGRGGLVLVEGTAGIGKTRLLGEARAAAEASGVESLAARGSRLEREFPFGAVRQLFEPPLADAAVRERWLAGAARSAEAVFAPPGGEGALAGEASFAALHGLYWLAVNAASDGPLLLAVDDVQWCDAPSLRFLAYLARRLEGVPILAVATLRTGEDGADVALLAEIAGDPATRSIRPAPLGGRAVTELVRARLGPEADARFCDACHRATRGNPLFLHELLKTIAAERVAPDARSVDAIDALGPRAVSRTVLVRLARLAPDAVAVARAVAILGDSADLPAVAALAEIDEARAAEATGALAAAEILRPEPPLGFVHPLVRDAVELDVPPGERELQHARAARMLADAGAPAEQVAAHLLVVPRRGDEWAAGVLHEAGRAATRRGAPESAIAYLERALAEPPPPESRSRVLLELGLMQMHANGRTAIETLDEAFRAQTDPVLRAVAGFTLARTLMFMSRPAESAALTRRLGAELPPELGDLRSALEALELTTYFFGNDDPTILPRFERARGGLAGEGPGARMLAAIAAFQWSHGDGRAEECAALALEALADDVLVEADDSLFPVPAVNVLVVSDRDEALALWDAHTDLAHRRGTLFAALTGHLWRGFAYMRRGDLTRAEELLAQALDEMIAWGSAEAINAYPCAFLAQAQVERGDPDAAERTIATANVPPEASDVDLFLRAARTELALARGRFDAALAEADGLAAFAGRIANPAWVPWRTLRARALDGLGRLDEARAAAEEELEAARRFGAPGAIGRALRVLGVAERERGLPRLEEAVAVLDGTPARLELAKAQAALGTALRLARRPSDARDPLRRALELAAACGADGLVEHVRAELHAAGARPRRDALSGAGSLTPSERRVASLAAAGETNRDIAQALYVTPKTVEVHLTNAYRKLGIGSRRELAGALGDAS
jgi:DNA-binding CsgD family transcriptional regulator